MKQYKKNKAVPKRLRSMKKRIERSLALVGILIMSLSLSGCEKLVEADVSTETRSQTTAAETTKATDKETQKKEQVEPIGKDSYGSPAYPLPDDWTFEKIVNLIEIDGIPLSLSSDAEDFNNINKKIKAEWDKNFIHYYDVYYEDDIILTVKKSKNESFDGAILCYGGNNQEIIDAISFAGYSLREINEIYDYMDKNFTVSESGDAGKRCSFIENDSVLEIGFIQDTLEKPTAVSVIVSIREVKE